MKKLTGNQSKLDANKNGKIDAEDFKILRGDKYAKGSTVKGGGVKMMSGGTIYDKIKSVDNWKFTNGYSFVFEVNNKKIGFLAYNSGSDTKKYTVKESLNLSSLKNLSGIVDNSIILSIQSHYYDKATKMTKMELSGNDLEMLIVTNHNVNSFEIFKQNKKMANGGAMNETFPETDAMSYAGGGGVSDSDFERDYKKVKQHIKEGYGKIDSDYVEYTWENLSDITYSAIEDKLIKRLRKDGLLKYAQGGSTSGWCYSIGGL